jgi:hypothetical protein
MEHVRSARRPRTVQGNFIRTAVFNGLYFVGGVLISRGAVLGTLAPFGASYLAAVPKENTIGIITTTQITSWIFSATEPETPANGMVWIYTGMGSPIEFNALKKNGVQVYPISARQYVSGAWVDVTAMSYQNGAWADWWNGELYDSGNQYTGVTGGWFSHPNDSKNYVAFDADGIRFINGEGTTTAVTVYTQNKIDVTRFSKLRVIGSATSYDGNNIKIGITNSNTTGYYPAFVASAQISKTGSINATLDLSGVAEGSYYIAIWSKYANFKITQIMLEV